MRGALVLNPTWAVWSMKARGGYITAFTATAALLWVILGGEHEPAHDRDIGSAVKWAVAAVLTWVICLAQPLWLPGILPIVLILLIAERRLMSAIAYVSVTGAGALVLRPSGGPPLGNADLWGSLPRIAHQIHVNLTGAYYLGRQSIRRGPRLPFLA